MRQIHSRALIVSGLLCSTLSGCSPMNNGPKVVPSLEYARALGAGSRQDVSRAQALSAPSPIAASVSAIAQSRAAAAQVQPVSVSDANSARFRYAADAGADAAAGAGSDVVTNISHELADP